MASQSDGASSVHSVLINHYLQQKMRQATRTVAPGAAVCLTEYYGMKGVCKLIYFKIRTMQSNWLILKHFYDIEAWRGSNATLNQPHSDRSAYTAKHNQTTTVWWHSWII
jgi:hypothetical protein